MRLIEELNLLLLYPLCLLLSIKVSFLSKSRVLYDVSFTLVLVMVPVFFMYLEIDQLAKQKRAFSTQVVFPFDFNERKRRCSSLRLFIALSNNQYILYTHLKKNLNSVFLERQKG
jgi:hypothetical protein